MTSQASRKKKKTPLAFLYKDLVLLLAKLSPEKRKKVISVLRKKHIECLSEVFLNFLNNNLTRSSKVVQSLKKYKTYIRKVASKGLSTVKKRKILRSQRGGAILSILLPLAASVITGLLTK